MFLDLKSACDHVEISVLLNILKSKNFHDSLVYTVSQILFERKVFVKPPHLDQPFGPHSCSRSLPQGGVVSPLLPNVYIDSLGLVLENEVDSLQFADDTGLHPGK